MSNLHSIINMARDRFTDPELAVAPDLSELAADYDIDLKTLKTVAFKDNWDAIRNRKVKMYERELVRAEAQEITAHVGDIAKARTKLFQDCFDLLNKQLNPVFESIVDRLPEMKDADVISHAKTLVQLSLSMQKMIDQLQKDVKEEFDNEKTEAKDIINSILQGKIIQAVQHGSAMPAYEDIEQEAQEQDVVFKELDGRP